MIYLGCAFYILFVGLIAHSQFEDLWIRKTGTMVQGTIETTHSSKSLASGMVVYSLPDGEVCRDWTELGPNSDVHPGEALVLSVDDMCGHPVSTKKTLWPWAYLCLCVGGIFHLLLLARRADRSDRSQEPPGI